MEDEGLPEPDGIFAEIMKLSSASEAKPLLMIRSLHPVRTIAKDHCLRSDLDRLTVH